MVSNKLIIVPPFGDFFKKLFQKIIFSIKNHQTTIYIKKTSFAKHGYRTNRIHLKITKMFKTVQVLRCDFIFQKIHFFHGLAFLDHKRQIFKSNKSHVEKLNSCQYFVNFRMNHGIPAINFSGLMYIYILTFNNKQNDKILLKNSVRGGNNNGFI